MPYRLISPFIRCYNWLILHSHIGDRQGGHLFLQYSRLPLKVMKPVKSISEASKLDYNLANNIGVRRLFRGCLPEIPKTTSICPWEHEITVISPSYCGKAFD